VVVAASFWTWLWGPLGLLLSTPLTLCLVVLARHVDRLRFLDVMLGDQPALTPQQAAYQRMLTGDPMEAIEQARSFLKEGSVADYYEKILLGALRLAQADAESGRLDDDRLENIYKCVSEIVEDLAEHGNDSAPETKAKGRPSGKVVSLSGASFGKPVFCIPGLGRLDDCAVLVVADSLKRAGIDARVSGATTAIEDGEAASICVCYLENVPKPRTDYAVRKLSRKAPAARIVICLLNEAEPSGHPSSQQKAAPRSLRDVVAAFAEPESRSESVGN
jgi:hypothetical protein